MVDEHPTDAISEEEFFRLINNKMQVPDRLLLHGNRQLDSDTDFDLPMPTKSTNMSLSKMYIPNSIVLTDDNKYRKGVRIENMDDDGDFRLLKKKINRSIQLIEPPETLSLDDYQNMSKQDLALMQSFENDQDMSFLDDEEAQNFTNVMSSSMLDNHNQIDLTALTTSDPSILLVFKKQLRFLNRRVIQLEKENQERRKRDFLMYSFGVLYLAYKTFGLVRKFL